MHIKVPKCRLCNHLIRMTKSVFSVLSMVDQGKNNLTKVLTLQPLYCFDFSIV